MKNESNNVIPINQKKFPIVGIVLFGVIFLYIAINFYLYISKGTMSFYVVQAEALEEHTVKKAFIVRDEDYVYAVSDGYVNYYLGNASKVAKGSKLCSLTEETDIYALFTDYQGKNSLEKDDLISVKNEVLSFRNHFDTSDYSEVKNIRENITGKIREILDRKLLENLPQLIEKTGTDISFQTVLSDEAGIVSYFIDKYTGYFTENISSNIFEDENIIGKDIRTTDKIAQGSAICRLVTDENWKIILQLDEEEYVDLLDKKKLNICIKKDEMKVTVPVEFIKKDNDFFCILSMNNYMVRYIDDRFLEIDIRSDAEQGLRIPLSSIVKKDFYLIPIEYISSDNGNHVVDKIVYDDKNGSKSIEKVPLNYIYNDGKYAYVSAGNIEEGVTLEDSETKSTFNVSITGKLEGVYQVNKGYSVFTRIEKLYDNDEYCVIKNNTAQGIRIYDHIILESDKAEESAIIY